MGRYTQFVHSVRDEDLPLGIDIWVLSGPDVPRVLSDQGQLGLEWRVGNSWLFSLEGYLREFDDVITENFGENPNDPADDFLRGRGRSYGVDLFAQRFRGNTTGWITVGWLKALRTFLHHVALGNLFVGCLLSICMGFVHRILMSPTCPHIGQNHSTWGWLFGQSLGVVGPC